MFVRQVGDGPPVLLLHGQPGEGRDWDAVSALLADGHRVIVPDRPGYGASRGPAVGVAANAEAARRTLAEAAAVPAVVVGHSFGGAVALRLAELHPEAVAGLVLVAPAGNARCLGTMDRVLALPLAGDVLSFALIRGTGSLAWAAGRRLPPMGWDRLARLAGVDPERLRDSAAAWASGRVWRSFAVEQRAVVEEMPAIEAGLAAIDVPVDVVAGRQDRVVPPDSIETLAAALARATVDWVDPGAHLLLWQAPEVIAGHVRRLSGLAGPRAAADSCPGGDSGRGPTG